MDYIEFIKNYSKKNHVRIYLVGGAVRDIILGRQPSDYDFALEGDCHAAAGEVAEMLGGSYVEMHSDVGRVVTNGIIFDFTNFKGDGIVNDLMERDFTLNAIALDLMSRKYIDPLGGIKDIENRLIRLVSNHALEDDPIRMLRAIRLSGKLGFNIEGETLEIIRKSASLLSETAGERILDELYKILEGSESHRYFKLMEGLGLLKVIFPVMEKMKKVGWCRYHTVDALTHSLLTLEFFEKSIGEIYKSRNGDAIKAHMMQILNGRERIATTKLAALLHDIGKPAAMKVEGDRVSFRGHDTAGVEEIVKIFSKIPFSTLQRSIIIDVVRGHMRILGLYKQGASNRAIYRIFNEFGENTIDVLISSLFDVTATRSLLDDSGETGIYYDFILSIIDRYFTYKNLPQKLVTGRDVIEITGARGKEIGNILRDIDEKVFYGTIKNREEALEFIRGFRG